MSIDWFLDNKMIQDSLPVQLLDPPSTNLLNIPSGDDYQSLFDNPVDAYLATLGSSESVRVMLSTIQRFVDLFKADTQQMPVQARQMNWSVLNRQALVFAIHERKKTKDSLSSIRLMLSAVRGVAKEAWQMGQIRTDTYMRIKEVKAPRGSTLPAGRALPLSQMNLLLQACRSQTGPIAARDLAMVSILMVCGLRRSELVSINREAVNREQASIKILGKGNKERMVYLDDEAMVDVSEWMDEFLPYDTGPLFPRIRRGGDVTNQRLSDQSVRYILENRCIQAGIDVARPHDMRRSFITHLLDSVDPLTVQAMAGHASMQTTARYDRRGEKRKQEAANKFRN